MSELTFSKQFLTTLDSRPIKLSSDHISDPKTYPAQSAYTLPKLPPPHPARPKKSTTSSSSAPTSSNDSASISITLKPMRSTSQTITLDSITPSTTSIYDLKSQYGSKTNTDVSKIKLLYNKKPTADSKTVAELVGDEDTAAGVEFSVMVMGGGGGVVGTASSPVATPPVEVPKEKFEEGMGGSVAQGPSGKEVLKTEEFWDDLKGFLVQRLRDEAEGERLVGLFRGAV